MTESLQALLTELERFGETNDETAGSRADKMLNITRDTGELLAVLVRATGAARVLEIGTSNGYSTLWLAAAAHASGGTVITVEHSEAKVVLARQTFRRSGLASVITLLPGDAGRVLADAADASLDLIFLDAERSEYPGYWPQLKRVLRPRGLLVVDNATSHVAEMAPFVELVNADVNFTTCLATVGKGEFLAVKGAS